MFANQGLYNGFLAGLIWGLVLGLNQLVMVQLFFVICVVIAIFGGFTSNKSIM